MVDDDDDDVVDDDDKIASNLNIISFSFCLTSLLFLSNCQSDWVHTDTLSISICLNHGPLI